MQPTQRHRPSFNVVGLSIRTNNAREMAPEGGGIAEVWERFLADNLSERLAHRAEPGVLYAVYTAFDSDETGPYTFVLGERVTSLEDQPAMCSSVVVPESTYSCFTVGPGPIDTLIMDTWRDLWDLPASSMGGARRYLADFETYDHRARNPAEAVVDVWVGITPTPA